MWKWKKALPRLEVVSFLLERHKAIEVQNDHQHECQWFGKTRFGLNQWSPSGFDFLERLGDSTSQSVLQDIPEIEPSLIFLSHGLLCNAFFLAPFKWTLFVDLKPFRCCASTYGAGVGKRYCG